MENNISLCFNLCSFLDPVTLTFGVVHIRASYLVHQQHKDEAQDQRHSDAGVKLLMTVFMFPTGPQGDVYLNLCIWNLRSSDLAVTVVSTCKRGQRDADRLLDEMSQLVESINTRVIQILMRDAAQYTDRHKICCITGSCPLVPTELCSVWTQYKLWQANNAFAWLSSS